MTLIQQFPDVSIQMKPRRQLSSQKEIAKTKERNDKDQALSLYYDNEFRKWHNKLALIIGSIIACLLAALVGVSKFF